MPQSLRARAADFSHRATKYRSFSGSVLFPALVGALAFRVAGIGIVEAVCVKRGGVRTHVGAWEGECELAIQSSLPVATYQIRAIVF